jgi:hypothetical protein
MDLTEKVRALEQEFREHQMILQDLDAERCTLLTRLVELQGAIRVCKELAAAVPEVPFPWARDAEDIANWMAYKKAQREAGSMIGSLDAARAQADGERRRRHIPVSDSAEEPC